MKIIREGNVPEKTPVQATCNNCNALIEFLPGEVDRVSDQRDGDFYSFRCPCCRGLITKNVSQGYSGPG